MWTQEEEDDAFGSKVKEGIWDQCFIKVAFLLSTLKLKRGIDLFSLELFLKNV